MTSVIVTDTAGRKIDLTPPAYLRAAMRRARERSGA